MGNILISYALKTQECLKADLNLSSTHFTGHIHCTIFKGTDPTSLTINLTSLCYVSVHGGWVTSIFLIAYICTFPLSQSPSPEDFLQSVAIMLDPTAADLFFSEIVSHQVQQI